ncbi:MAG: copper chaperone PCu(A)C [Hyphomicrobiales bacterium]
MIMRSLDIRSLLTAAILGACIMMAPAARAGGLEVRDAWIGLAPPVMKVHAGYFTVINSGGAERHLVGVESSAYGNAMLHVSREVNGVATMEHVHRVTLSPGKTVTFAPGGLHVMLMGPKQTQVEGASVPIMLVFEDGEKVPATATVRRSAAGAGGMDHGGHAAHQHKGM